TVAGVLRSIFLAKITPPFPAGSLPGNSDSELEFFCSIRSPDAVQSESMHAPVSSLVVILLLAFASGAVAQDKGTLNPHPLPPLANPNDAKTPAKELFGRKVAPTAGRTHVVGFYSSGCLAGATALPINGPSWQVMRLSRNRNWGHP